MTETFDIPYMYLEEAVKKLTALNKRARKLGAPEATYFTGTPSIRKYKMEDGTTHSLEYIPLTVTSEIIVVAGWKLLATIETAKQEDGTRLNYISGPEAERFIHYREAELSCDHCNVNRYRKIHYIVENTTTFEVKVVGSTCLKDFLGHDPQAAIFSLQFLKTFRDRIDDGFGAIGRGFFSLPFDDVILATIYVLRNNDNKYVKSADGGIDSPATWVEVRNVLTDPSKSVEMDHNLIEQDRVYAAKVYQKLEEVRNKWKDSPVTQIPEFEYKISLLVDLGYVREERRYFSVAVGAVFGSFIRILKEERTADESKVPSEFFGTVDKREIFELEIKGVYWTQGFKGMDKAIIYGVLKGTGNRFVWFASGGYNNFIDSDNKPLAESFKVKATVKAHNDDQKYGKQTVLTRVSLVK